MPSPALFEPAIAVVLEHEVGKTGDGYTGPNGLPNDPGGTTKYGVSLRWLQRAKVDVDGDGDVDGEDIRKLTREQAISLYRAEWWDAYGYARITDQAVATKLLDFAVHAGAPAAHKRLQMSVNTLLPLKRRIGEDGDLGSKSIAAINALAPGHLVASFVVNQAAFYGACIARNGKLEDFRINWMRRATWPLIAT